MILLTWQEIRLKAEVFSSQFMVSGIAKSRELGKIQNYQELKTKN